jgi:ABC-type polysaccharide/polyol phosphate transport system ATPase subunit
VILRGRVASLLEVGRGFHPELTGRENIYFNGAILGMTKQEIEDKFDEIVEFSDRDVRYARECLMTTHLGIKVHREKKRCR